MESLLSKNNMPIIAATATNNTNTNMPITASNVINSGNHQHYVNNLSHTNTTTYTTPNSSLNINAITTATTTSTVATTTTINNNHQQQTSSEDTEMRHRFKVVKLVSSQPYTRGRWTCFDYNDENQNTINISKHVPANKIAPNETLDQGSLLNDQNSNTIAPNNSDQSEVAIDNKIEQAMDLVKSHLMFAVREEVDVLKERIKELESDIQILMAHATPETLALLSNNRSSANANVNVANVNTSTSNININPD